MYYDISGIVLSKNVYHAAAASGQPVGALHFAVQHEHGHIPSTRSMARAHQRLARLATQVQPHAVAAVRPPPSSLSFLPIAVTSSRSRSRTDPGGARSPADRERCVQGKERCGA